MNIYLLSQHSNTGYDTYDSCVVRAPDEASARLMHPRGDLEWNGSQWVFPDLGRAGIDTWACPDAVTVEYIGTAGDAQSGVICASFNAG
jgi:hypothetical protein